MAKGLASDVIQTPDKMKPLLALSKQEPVAAAIALTADGEGVILLDKRAKPKKVRSMLRTAAAKAKVELANATIRFGRAEVDTDYDSSMVRFFINKDAPGNMRIKLVEVVKRIPYQKVELNVDPSLEDDSEEEVEGQGAPARSSPVPEQDEHALKMELGGLIQRIPTAAGSDANRKATLLKVAGLANDQLKAHDLTNAASTIVRLRQVLDATPVGPQGWPAVKTAWQDAIEAVDAQIAAFQAKLAASGDEQLEEIAEFGLNAVTGDHKVRLMAAMRDVDGGAPPDKLRAVINAFASHIDTDPKVMACDENPLGVPVSIRATLGPALAAMRDALHSISTSRGRRTGVQNMPLTLDRFVKIFTDDVSDDLLKNRTKKVNKAIDELTSATDALKKAGISAAATFEKLIGDDKQARDKATQKGTTTKEKYDNLDRVKERAREHAASAAKALRIEPSQQDVDKIKTLLNQQGGAKKLDDVVGKLGEAKDDKSKKLVIAAIKARWGLEMLTGDLDAKALPRIYQMMAMVPDDHIRGNGKLKEIRREKHPDDGETSFYRASEKLIVLNLDSTKGSNECIDDKGNVRKAKYFDHTTLHEIGHAVDEKIRFMNNKGKTSSFGGWRRESIRSVAEAGGRDKKFFSDFPDYPAAMLASYLVGVLATGRTEPNKLVIDDLKKVKNSGLTKDELLQDPGLQRAEKARLAYERDGWPEASDEVANQKKNGEFSDCKFASKLKPPKRMATEPILVNIFDNRLPLDKAAEIYMASLPDELPTDDVWAAIAKHPVIEWCRSVRLKGSSGGLWDAGKGAANTAKLPDDRIYQQSYTSEWWSYEAARVELISSYQFRSPAEWFAELYAAYHLGWLDQKHWMGKLDMSKEAT